MTISEIAAQMGVAPETTANQYIVEHYGGTEK